MRAQIAGALLFLSGFVPLWTGCTREPATPPCIPPITHENEKRLAMGGACARDADCRSGFCDRDVCVDVFEEHWRGSECDGKPPVDVPRAERRNRGCGGFLCLDMRCRSCTSDAECASYLGGGKCVRDDSRYPLLGWCRHAPKR